MFGSFLPPKKLLNKNVCFSITENRKAKQVLFDTSGSGEDIGKGCRRVNMVEI
jgi:hypothetical protein